MSPAALPLQTDSQSTQDGDGALKTSLNDSGVIDLSPKTDSCSKTETKTDFSPSSPGDSSSPQPKKGTRISPQIAENPGRLPWRWA